MTDRIDPIQAQLIAARKEQILNAATIIFAEHGFHKATIRMIAQQANIADGTIYNYFKNKTELLFGILDRLNESEERGDAFNAGLDAPFREFFVEYLRHRIHILWPNADVMRAVLPELLVNDDLRSAYMEQVVNPSLALAEAYFQALVDKGELRPINVQVTARTLAGTLLGLLMLQLLGDDQLAANWETLPETIADLILNGILPD